MPELMEELLTLQIPIIHNVMKENNLGRYYEKENQHDKHMIKFVRFKLPRPSISMHIIIILATTNV
jgi:hypothetical protein